MTKAYYLANRERLCANSRAWSRNSRATRNAASHRWRQRRAGFLAWLKSVPCADCDRKYPHFVMDFDHREAKSFNLSTWPVGHKSLEALQQEVQKCDVVCANCHRSRTFSEARI